MPAWKEYNYIRWDSLKNRTEYHPLVNIAVRNDGHEIALVALIDSGSEICTLNTEMAEPLGIDLGRTRKIMAGGIGGPGTAAYLSELDICLPDFGYTFHTPVVFTDTSAQMLLGQSDFFLHFNVLFEMAKGVFRLSRSGIE